MKEKLEKIYNITASVLFSVYSLIALILFLFIPKYNILFNGWWTLIILIPSIGSLLFQSNKLNSLYMAIMGTLFLLVAQNILPLNKCFTILLCLGIIFIGINIIKTTIKIPENKNSTTKFVPFYYAFFGSTEEKITTKFQGGSTKVVFGYLFLDLKDADIEDSSTLKVLSLFGETEIILPIDAELITTNTNILGGTENVRATTKAKNPKKIYIESISVFGSTKIK